MKVKEKIKELFTTKIDRDVTQELRVYCAKHKVNIQEVVEEALVTLLKEKK